MAKRKAFPLRLPQEVYNALKGWAEDELRSVNGQIEYLLLAALRKEGRWPRRQEADPPRDGTQLPKERGPE